MYLNAHCHLELSHLRGVIPPGLPFAEWLERIFIEKRDRPVEDAVSAMGKEIEEMRANRIVEVWDIDRSGLAEAAWEGSGLDAVVFREVINTQPETAEQSLVSRLAPATRAGVQVGLSPHAPYSTTPELLRACAREAKARNLRLCIHAAETPEETEMMVHGKGAMLEFLADRHLLPEDWRPPGLRPVPHLESCGVLGPGTLLAHLNDIDDEDLAILRRTGTSAVVCPGTHVYFERGAFPLERLLAADIPTYLGTDSLASNESLDMEREIALACELAPNLSRDAVAALAIK
ncbi:amidohydrolase family protein [bacterium]|nr:amidohydrolase family protein [bacterium]